MPGPNDLTASQLDRAAGVLLGLACGDALGAGYEFEPPLPPDVEVVMKGGGGFGWKSGEWTDDTQMAVPILVAAETAAAQGDSLLDREDDVAGAWVEWAPSAADVGNQTRLVLTQFRDRTTVTAEDLALAATSLHEQTGHTAGNGSLMRTAPVALAYLGDAAAITSAARRMSDLTHADPEAGDACVLWSLGISRAVLTGEFELGDGLEHLPAERRDLWSARIEDAGVRPPTAYPRNGWVVHAFQAAWSAIATTRSDGPEHYSHALVAAVRAGYDTDTVAAIAGSLLGARWGASAVPHEWRSVVHGWPGLTGDDLAARGAALVAT